MCISAVTHVTIFISGYSFDMQLPTTSTRVSIQNNIATGKEEVTDQLTRIIWSSCDRAILYQMHSAIAIGVFLSLMGWEVSGARILGIFPVPSKSHLTVTTPVMHALAKKGHDVTMFLPFDTGFKAPNYREIVYEDNTEKFETNSPLNNLQYPLNFVTGQFIIAYMAGIITEASLNTTAAKDLIKSGEKFDLIMMEFFSNEAFLAYARKFECPIVLINVLGAMHDVNRIFGNSAPYNYVPTDLLAFGDRMTLFERIQNTLANLWLAVTWRFVHMPRQQALADKYFSGHGFTVPPLEKIQQEIDLILINSHPAFSTPRPYMPNMKDVGGMHLKPVEPLPTDLQRYMDSSKNGVILLVFGSRVQFSRLPARTIQALLGAFARLPYDVLVKWEEDVMPNKPKNVRAEKWLPQNDVLAHPNLKLFMSHGGISSLMEAVHHRVPIVGIPVYGDQPRNIKFAQQKGYAEVLDFQTMTEDEVYDKVMKVLTDPEYRRNVEKVSAYWKDEMNPPLAQAVHWVEYVLKHGGAKHLKAAVTEQNFIQYLLLDVVFTILVILALFYLLIRKLFGLLCKKSRPTNNAKKTN